MRRRILVAIIGVTIVAVAVLTLPLSILIVYRDFDEARDNLTLVADRTATKITSDGSFADGPLELLDIDKSLEVGVYLPSGERVAGTGPDRADSVTSSAELLTIGGRIGWTHVVARPLIEFERQVAVIRVAEPVRRSLRHVPRDLAVLLAFDVTAVVVAAGVGAFVSSRLVRPLTAIRDDAVRLGDGDFSIEPRASGIAELDETAEALAETAVRLHRTMQRERAFSADASHQLRTPLTSLRLAIEAEAADPRGDRSPSLTTALAEIDRLESIITTLLDVARDRPLRRDRLDGPAWADGLAERWAPVVAGSPGRDLHVGVGPDIDVSVSRAVLDQVLDILLANAVRHGAGDISVGVDVEGDHLVVSVADEGRIERDPDDLFVRHDPGASGNGLGLALARSLAESEGGRLILASTDPTTFRIVVPDAGRRRKEV